MCGIFGIMIGKGSKLTSSSLKPAINSLFKLSESRGKEAAGIAILLENTIRVYKEPISASSMTRTKTYNKLINDVFTNKDNKTSSPLAIIGHSRLVTNGLQEINANNQPVISDDLVGVHNGIIVNDVKLWNQFPSLKRKYEVDTEVILSLIGKFYKDNKSLNQAVRSTFAQIEGSASIAVLNNSNKLVLATNTGSLYKCANTSEGIYIFASEQYILEMFLKTAYLKELLGQSEISRINPGYGCFVDVNDLSDETFPLTEKEASPVNGIETFELNVVEYPSENTSSPDSIFANKKSFSTYISKTTTNVGISESDQLKIIEGLKRCTKCILPETMPSIEFDEDGVCSYCRNYNKIEMKPEADLEAVLAKYRSKTGKPDCVVALSGGRDSSYCLHYIKTVLKMTPIAFCYDWGMVTDLARRNQARLCGKLGIEHIIISADINKKREYIRKNVLAWLKKPDLGIIPLFMAGDKPFYYYGDQIRKQNNILPVIYSMNNLERADFKSGFSGSVYAKKGKLYKLSLMNKLKILGYYGKQFLMNPSYINTSVFDTLFGFYCNYVAPHDYIQFYDYIKWDEEKVTSMIIDEYDWETAGDTTTTWRIGDGTTSFYNYIYFLVAGFTENDAFCSNQIREGMITREEAMAKIQENNSPRYESIMWYCDTIGIDFNETIKVINSIPRLYSL